MEVVILGVFTCSSHGCLAEMRLDLATDLPCQSASRCVYYVVFYRMGTMADRAFPAWKYSSHLHSGLTVVGRVIRCRATFKIMNKCNYPIFGTNSNCK